MLTSSSKASIAVFRAFDEAYICPSCRQGQKRALHNGIVDKTRPIQRRTDFSYALTRTHSPLSPIPTQTQLHRSTRSARNHTAASREQPRESFNSGPFAEVFGGQGPSSRANATSKSIKAAKYSGIRANLAEWQDLNGQQDVDELQIPSDDVPKPGEPHNSFTKLPHEGSKSSKDQKDSDEDLTKGLGADPLDESTDAGVETYAMSMGDLVELQAGTGVRILAIYIRGGLGTHQVYNINGYWRSIHVKRLLYCVPGFVDAQLVEPLLPYLPDVDAIPEDFLALAKNSGVDDLAIPRTISAPLVKSLTNFTERVQEIFRNNASRLDKAHSLLADEDDMTNMTLAAAAAKVLQKDEDSLSDHDLYAVHQTFARNRFAFSVDSRSHRQTGQLSIRAKKDLANVTRVVRWIREWQEDLAQKASGEAARSSTEGEAQREGVEVINEFLGKARAEILESRRDRQPTPHGLGPSKHRFPIVRQESCVRIRQGRLFRRKEMEIISFFRSWALEHNFDSSPQLFSLPPVLLQATGLYTDVGFGTTGGHIFLQELGVIPPFDHAYRYDPHLLLPSLSKSRVMLNMLERVNNSTRPSMQLTDEMAHLRKDWGGLAAYCIDDAGAHEIDDGISVEAGAPTAQGQATHWIHVHVANPTAWFRPDHELARFAAQMGETVYTPEQTHTMLPTWASRDYLSLGPNRPCLTFSTRVNDQGDVIEREITPGTLRNVISLTPRELTEVLRTPSTRKIPSYTLTVGGIPPPPPPRKSVVPSLSRNNLGQLRLLQRLSEKLQARRRAAGGLFFEVHRPEVSVWDNFRAGRLTSEAMQSHGRRFEGDPIISTEMRSFVNYFDPHDDAASVLVREMMLLACETAAAWCRDRQIPGIFRGTTKQSQSNLSPAQFYEQVLAPQSKKTGGKFSQEQGFNYLKTFGKTGLSTTPYQHQILGLETYGKVTSPLRRYGDMVVHWQIEAALREEAETGRSLVTQDRRADRRFLPFSRNQINEIRRVLQPREGLITQTKQNAISYWISQLMFRAFYFGEKLNSHLIDGKAKDHGSITMEHLPETLHVIMTTPASLSRPAAGHIVEFGLYTHSIGRPTPNLPFPRMGDVWEARINFVTPQEQNVNMNLTKLLYRVGEDGYEGWFGRGPPLDLYGQDTSEWKPSVGDARTWGQFTGPSRA